MYGDLLIAKMEMECRGVSNAKFMYIIALQVYYIEFHTNFHQEFCHIIYIFFVLFSILFHLIVAPHTIFEMLVNVVQ